MADNKDEKGAKGGHAHIISQNLDLIIQIFSEMGFSVAQGPEIEEEYYNFDALNIPKEHPARDLWDTFWLKPRSAGELLRTHTSTVQIRHMQKHEPPIRIIAPGRVFRYEATDATHEVNFHQLEGLVVDKNITLSHLKGTLETFFEKFFGEKMNIRFRPSYFPFVEPGVEVDIEFQGEWLEVLGAGLVHPKVLSNVGINPRIYSGFAFGVGIDRLVMQKYGIDDIRLLYKGDLRLIHQF